MLLVVNNRREALNDVCLTVDLPMPKTVKEAIANNVVEVNGKVIKENFAPFDVKVYIWSEK